MPWPKGRKRSEETKILNGYNISVREVMIEYRDWLLGGHNLFWQVSRDEITNEIILKRE